MGTPRRKPYARGLRLNLGAEFVKLDQPLSNFQWAIEQGGQISQARFESESAAQIAYRNHLLSRRED